MDMAEFLGSWVAGKLQATRGAAASGGLVTVVPKVTQRRHIHAVCAVFPDVPTALPTVPRLPDGSSRAIIVIGYDITCFFLTQGNRN